jgi:hypothetical protein
LMIIISSTFILTNCSRFSPTEQNRGTKANKT